ncbi:hypothetical protein Tco_0756284 [Tanacetum coccineum]
MYDGRDEIHGVSRVGNLRFWYCNYDNERKNITGMGLSFPDYRLAKYSKYQNNSLVWGDRNAEWFNVSPKLGTSSQESNNLGPRDYTFREWTLIKVGHTDIRIVKDPLSRSFYDYKWVFDLEIDELADEYELGIGKKGHMLDKTWEYCKDAHRDNTYWWHDHGFEKEECDEMEIEIEKYDPPKVQVETFKVRKYSFKGGQKFVCVTKEEGDTLPLKRRNGSRFKEMIRKEFDINTHDKTFWLPKSMVQENGLKIGKLDTDLQGTQVDQTKYHSMIGGLMYFTASRPDIAFARFVCARYQARPTKKHLKEVKRIFRYLRQTINMGLWYSKDSGFKLIAYLDADLGGCNDDCKSTSGGIQFLGDKLVSWSSKKQACTAMSTAEAEYVSLSACCAQVIWMRMQLLDYGCRYNKIPMYCDSQSTIELYFVGMEYQLVGLFTKALPKERFEYLIHMIAMRCMTPTQLERLAKLSS